MNGIIVIDKPQHYTSFDVIAVLRKVLKQKKIGHMGTLDPLATGVLPVLLGESTKFQIFVENNKKEYVTTLKLGITTNTQDVTGETILKKDCSKVKIEDIKRVLKSFVGRIEQIPPMFSAIKKNGQPLYKLARKGEIIIRNSRKIIIDSIELLSENLAEKNLELKILCSGGTYIRTLCNDIGNSLGCGATMISLRRTMSNGFLLSDCIKLEKSSLTNLKSKIVSTDRLFCNFERAKITNSQLERIRNGGNLMLSRIDFDKNLNSNQTVSLFCNNEFVGIGHIDIAKAELKIIKVIQKND